MALGRFGIVGVTSLDAIGEEFLGAVRVRVQESIVYG